MKKTYINPSMTVVRLAMTRPLAFSDPNLSIDFDDAIEAGDVEVKNYITDVNIWDEEW